MKSIFIGMLLIFCALQALPQRVFFGYPSSSTTLEKGDLIILNLPWYEHAKFTKSEKIVALEGFVCANATRPLKVTVNHFSGSQNFDFNLSVRLAKSLTLMLEADCRSSNFSVVGVGRSVPIFFNEKSPLFNRINTRLEILME